MYQQEEYEVNNEGQEDVSKINALNLKWTLGFNFQLTDGVHNLTNEKRKEIFYPVAHTGVIYDYENNTQRLLQGHCNRITATAYCKFSDIIVTADCGPDSMLVVWDASTGIPKKTIFEPHPNGCQALDISQDGQFIVTLSKEANTDTDVQSLSLWEWNKDDEPCLITNEFDRRIKDYQYFVRFNSDDNTEFATTGKTRIVFWRREGEQKGFNYYSPGNIPSLKVLTQTVFIPDNTQVVTGTTDGHIIVWDISLIIEKVDTPKERRAIKLVDLMNKSKKPDGKKGSNSINILKIQDNYLVIGSSNGSIRFYDFQYRIIAWFEDAIIGSISNISFANTPMIEDNEDEDGFDDERKDKGENEPKFICPDFIVVDLDATITMLNYKLFEELDDEKKKGTTLMKSIVSPIIAMSCRPNSNVIGICCENGYLYEWNFQEKSSVLSILRVFDTDKENIPNCIDYSPDGNWLSVATKSGKIHIFDCKEKQWQNSVLEVSENEQGKPKVNMQVFSSDSKNLATMDADYAVSLFTIDHRQFDVNIPEKEWQFVGKHRIHHSEIKSIAFGESKNENDKKYYRLFSIGADMKMVEYEVLEIDYSKQKEKGQQINYIDRLKLKSIYPIEQETIPTACIWYPINMYKEDVLLTVNEEFKIKLWQFMKDNFKFCKKTCLGPIYGGAINKLLILNQNDAQNDYQDKYLAYSTKEKVVGIIKLPLEGNPNQTMGLIAHPDKITSISCSNDGKHFFSSGSDDYCVNVWSVNVQALEQIFATNPNEDPYPKLLEGGEDGQTHQDLKNFFYYSQIRSKDEHTTKARKLDGKVPLIAIPDMMRSMGYYPTNKEIENMQNEIRFSKYLDPGEQVEELDLNMFLKLFVNHRPVQGIGKSKIAESLNTLTKSLSDSAKEIAEQAKGQSVQPKTYNIDGIGEISLQDLKKILTTEGERMTNEEFDECLKILCGENEDQIPQQINVNNLCEDILGFEDLEGEERDDNIEDQYEDEENEEYDQD
ncbi:WD-40 protein, putative (macronuclear) [Tetrahymena thermophila SB210]|uniref:Cilia- and flagella-associated protein 251 n=1 Tax=Tetrahymena thermophila (strain SB210) TaxID=312017 RepID=CF251_TETTS|nr:WD-40 protein, putative [Tetrahymena thermophila SB210]Q24DE2.2 RecName: Full=Cilia- and flagella-associated protein 251 [Tetrahymena thermophila SB210]EAS05799.2 WD-40 protein, putative [Tetrahymena thermophila SB210]|eukprot:XP_001026044.2 WD-40 protein, putative [Tetrahymena thermophila SB210]